MRKFLLVIMSVLSLAGPAGAAALSDFSDAFQVETRESAAYYAVGVPLALYAGVHKPKLEDVRFFSSDHVMLPHAVYRRFMDPAYEEPLERLSALKVEPLKGAVVLDLGTLGRAPSRFDIKWIKPGLIAVVETSGDKKTWQSLAKEPARTAQSFTRAGVTSLVVPAITSRYVRITTDGAVAQVSAALAANLSADADPQRLWMELGAKAGAAGEYYIDGRGFMPFDRFKLKLKDGSFAPVKLYGRNKVSEPWQLLADDTFYRYRFGSETVAKDTVLLRPAARRYLKLVTEKPFWHGPALAAGWTPDRLIFVAKGKPPYILAFGSDKVERFDPKNEPMLKTLTYPATDLVREARVGKPVGTKSRWLLMAGFVLVMLLVGVSIFVVLRKPREDDAPLDGQASDE